jgi:PadR family transcriptional regulator PadR
VRISKLPSGLYSVLTLCILENKAMYGYQIVKEIVKKSRGSISLDQRILYPTLHNLEEAGELVSNTKMTAKRQKRRYYHITAKGIENLKSRKKQLLEFFKFMDSLLCLDFPNLKD